MKQNIFNSTAMSSEYKNIKKTHRYIRFLFGFRSCACARFFPIKMAAIGGRRTSFLVTRYVISLGNVTVAKFEFNGGDDVCQECQICYEMSNNIFDILRFGCIPDVMSL